MAMIRFDHHLECDVILECAHEDCCETCHAHFIVSTDGKTIGDFYIKEIKEGTIDWSVQISLAPSPEYMKDVALCPFHRDREVT